MTFASDSQSEAESTGVMHTPMRVTMPSSKRKSVHGKHFTKRQRHTPPAQRELQFGSLTDFDSPAYISPSQYIPPIDLSPSPPFPSEFPGATCPPTQVHSAASYSKTLAHTFSHTPGMAAYVTSSSDESKVEVTGNPILSPMNSCMLHLRHAIKHKPSYSCLVQPSRCVSPMHLSPLVDIPSPDWSVIKRGVSSRVTSPMGSPAPPSPSPSHSRLAKHSQHVSPMLFSPPVNSLSHDWSVIERDVSSRVTPSPLGSPAPSSPSLSILSSPPCHQPHRQKQLPWHHGLYCVEFADGLQCMDQSGLSQKDAFSEAFLDCPWVRRTFQDNKRQWLEIATPTARYKAIMAGRTSKGLWSRFSKAHPIIKSNRV